MAPFHDEHFLIISPGSTVTLVQFGIGESYSPPTIEIPTKVYKHPSLPNAFISESANEEDAIFPIVKGDIINVDALNFFLKLIYKSILKKHPNVSNIPFLLISTSSWSKLDIESITKYVFESMELNAFTILPQSLASVYAYGAQPNSIVVDIGFEKTEIITIIDYEVIEFAKITIPFGGESINQSLKKYLPNLSAKQIEALKKSNIYEVLSHDDKKKSFFGVDGLNEKDEDEFDVASIVTSNKSTREILEEREKQKQGNQVVNSKLEKNTFYDDDHNEITVGKERFKGTEELISEISKNIAKSLYKINDLEKKQNVWDNIIIVGKTIKIPGFLDSLNTKIIEDNLIVQEIPSTAAFQSSASNGPSVVLSQVPISIKFNKMPEYFPEWKKQGFSTVHFLGGQIVSKQIFGTRNESMFITRQSYNDKGPIAVWDIAF